MINVRVLIAVRWIRRPLSPTLHISLSLAAADACTSTLIGVGLVINSYLPHLHNIELCHIQVWLEMYRLSGIIITVFHLLALSINHWLGILKPLHYTTIVTSKKITIVTVMLWVVPIAFFMTYFLTERNFWQTCPITDNSFDKVKFRIVFISFFVVPLIMMIYFYSHILYIVRRQQRTWATLSRSGSQRSRGMTRASTQQRRTMEGNVKAVYTTLLILGSFLVGWLPAVTIFVLICADGCVFATDKFAQEVGLLMQFVIGWLSNILIILKTVANPIIYSARMIEIKDGMRRMELALSRMFCNSNRRDRYTTNLHQPLNFGCSAGSGNANMTALCRLNGSVTTRRSGRSNYPNTLV
ncbi:trace amine-associated receptor 4-like [Atheta coriaria]